MRYCALIIAIMLATFVKAPLVAQELVTTTSDRTIEISSNFSGQTITIFGAINPSQPTTAEANPLGIKMMLLGPDEAVEVRKKQRMAGIWVNGEKKRFTRTPSFAALLTSKGLNRDIFEAAQGELFAKLAPQLASVDIERDEFASELIRLRRSQNHVQIKGGSVELISPTVFSARIELPTTIASGTYLVVTEIFEGKRYLASSVDSFDVRKSGVERFIFEASTDIPWAYGLATLVVALLTGWLGSIVFRRS